jgi:hypothetical protein
MTLAHTTDKSKKGENVFDTNNQSKDWQKLNQAIDNAETQVPCTSYPEAFFPDKGKVGPELAWALEICKSCPVQIQCAEYGIKHESEGIWGGLTSTTRAKIRSKRQAA